MKLEHASISRSPVSVNPQSGAELLSIVKSAFLMALPEDLKSTFALKSSQASTLIMPSSVTPQSGEVAGKTVKKEFFAAFSNFISDFAVKVSQARTSIVPFRLKPQSGIPLF